MLKRNPLNMLSQSHKYNGPQLKINCFTIKFELIAKGKWTLFIEKFGN